MAKHEKSCDHFIVFSKNMDGKKTWWWKYRHRVCYLPRSEVIHLNWLLFFDITIKFKQSWSSRSTLLKFYCNQKCWKMNYSKLASQFLESNSVYLTNSIGVLQVLEWLQTKDSDKIRSGITTRRGEEESKDSRKDLSSL